jgi:chromosome segregation ATPase
MPKSRKQKTSVRVKDETGPQKKKPAANKKISNKPILDSQADLVATESTIDAQKPDSAGIRESEQKIVDLADVSEERASIISIVKGLEGQVETAFKLKEALETELDMVRNKLSEQMEARAQLEAQVKSLEIQAAQAEQLRDDISFAEEERNKFANLLAKTRTQLEEIATERDELANQINSAQEHIKELESEKMALEAQVMNLKDKIIDADRLRKELADVNKSYQSLCEKVSELTRRLEAAEVKNDALEGELSGAHQNAQTLRKEAEVLRDKLTNADNYKTDMRIQLEDLQITNKELMKKKTQLENELKMLNINYEAVKNELEAFKNALRDIRSEATQTSGRVRQRYFKPSGTTI